MTNTTLPDELLKSDVLGRVRTPRERREGLLDEFERSGLTGQKFAALVGVKYQTFASWLQKRRKTRASYPQIEAKEAPSAEVQPVQWLEAVTEAGGGSSVNELRVELPGGANLTIADAGQAVLAARLLRELATMERSC